MHESAKEARAVIVLRIPARDETYDLDVPLDISARELLDGLNSAFDLNIDTTDVATCCVHVENPIALVRGRKSLGEFGMRNGSVVTVITGRN